MVKNKNKFEQFFHNNKGNIINKRDHYFDIYERHFYKYQNTREKSKYVIVILT